MEKETQKEVYSIWVDWSRRVVSFQKVAGFEEIQYQTHEEMLAFAIEKGSEGFGIQ